MLLVCCVVELVRKDMGSEHNGLPSLAIVCSSSMEGFCNTNNTCLAVL